MSSKVCRHLHNVVNNAPELRYIIELFSEGFTRRRMAHSGLEKANYHHHTRNSCPPERKRHIYFSNYAARSTAASGGAKSSALPSITRDRVERFSFPEHARRRSRLHYAFDVPQDLLVLGYKSVNPNGAHKYYLRLLTLSSMGSSPHPVASQEILQLSYDTPFMIDETQLRVAGSLLAVGLLHPMIRSQIVVWNWRTGDQLMDIGRVRVNRVRLQDFCFLSESRIMFLCTTPSMIFLEIWSIDPDSPVVNNGRTLLRLSLPDLGSINFHNYCITYGPFQSDIPQNAPFVKRPGGCVYAIILFHLPPRPFSPALLFVVHHDKITALLQTSENVAVAIPWDDWGPRSTRMFSGNFTSHHWAPVHSGWVYHERLLGSFMTSYQEDLRTESEKIFDFNIRPYVRQLAAEAEVERRGELVVAPTTSHVRVDETGRTVTVTTSLPFYSFPLEVPGTDQRCNFMLDENHLLGILSDGPERPWDLDIFFFD
ncbi:hypothetical protein EVG20_g4341 [Dentipellis fragilis]|uniref:F-box domain-containing protein n=1 Tax=Dentipellis fragilis TaxID=205917 RepID=A0A4Y9Z045_9AGAM|nr:hypothetical protein EVG20_g4341 [Dentipellis fragilis]